MYEMVPLTKTWISWQKARSFGACQFRKAKQGYLMLVWNNGVLQQMGFAMPIGFYLQPYNH